MPTVTGLVGDVRVLDILVARGSSVAFCAKQKKKNPLKEKRFLTGACECKRSFGAKISQPLISIQPHLLLCLVVTWLLMCD